MQEVLEYLRGQLEKEYQSKEYFEKRMAHCARGSAAYNEYLKDVSYREGGIAAYQFAIMAIERAGAAK